MSLTCAPFGHWKNPPKNPYKLGKSTSRKLDGMLEGWEPGCPLTDNKPALMLWERKIAAGMILEAINNLEGKRAGANPKQGSGDGRAILADAASWVTRPSTQEEPFSFAWCCGRLNIPVRRLREAIAERIVLHARKPKWDRHGNRQVIH